MFPFKKLCLSVVPVLEEYQVYKKICKAKSQIHLLKGTYQKRMYSGLLNTRYPYPSHPPFSEDELRNIAKTAFCSKVFEAFLSDWLMPIISPYLEPLRFGLKGASITQYLVKLVQFIHVYLDMKNPHAAVIALIDH